MKKIILTAAITAAMGFSVMNVCAYSDEEFLFSNARMADGFYTVITDTEGDIHTVDGIISSGEIESGSWANKISSYEIYKDDEAIMNVQLNDIHPKNDTAPFAVDGEPIVNGYYSVKFVLSEKENTEAYLTGLSDSNIDLVQEEMINAKIENSEFSMESLDFIDAEKTNMPNDGDDLMCWAAASSNMLHYTGWGAKAGFDSPDDIFDVFVDSFTDYGSQYAYGLSWFFNGLNEAQGHDNWADVKEYGESGKYLNEYAVWENMNTIDVQKKHENIIEALEKLEKGCGMGISLGWVNDSGVRKGGHAITLWGYIIDKDFTETDMNRYKALIVSDSDFDMPSDSNRRIAPNKLCALNMIPYTEGIYDTWKFDGYSTGTGTIELFAYLVPYSDDIETETDADASLDGFSNVDIFTGNIKISNDVLNDKNNLNSVFKGDTIYLTPEFRNNSELNLEEGNEFKYSVKITEKSTENVKFEETYTYNAGIVKYEYSNYEETDKAVVDLTDYEPGEYTVELEIAKSDDFKEAYYYNNSYKCDFTVVENKYDLSNVKINPQVGELKGGKINVAFSYEGLDTLDILQREDVSAVLYHSYYDEGIWSDWDAYTDDYTPGIGSALLSDSVIPDEYTIYPNGEKVKFRLSIKTSDKTIPVVNIYSDEMEIKYLNLALETDDSHIRKLTPVASGAKSLKDGEQIAVKVKDASNYNSGEDLFCDVIIYAEKNGESIELQSYKNVSVPSGGESEVLKFNSWSAELDGRYNITAEVKSDYNELKYLVSELIVGEEYIYKVTTSNDVVDEDDGEISLREAVMLAKNSTSEDVVITFEEDLQVIMLNEPIVIDSRINIDGGGVVIYGSDKTQLFKVENGGELRCDMVILSHGYSKQSGGAVENKGGKVYIENSRIIYCKSGVLGGGIYSDGGNVTLKNSSFKGNISGYGGAVGMDNGAEVNMINCNLFENKSNGGAVYNNGGHMSVIYSTIANNSITSASSTNGGGITSLGETDIFGSIITYNDSFDLSGKINSYGNYISTADKRVNIDDNTQIGSGEEVFMLDEKGLLTWEDEGNDEIVSYKVNLSSVIENGIYVKNLNGNIAYSKDGKNWIQTEVKSVFGDEEYSHDVLGREHKGLFGSNSKVCNDIKIINVVNGSALVYVPSAQDAVLIEKHEKGDNTLSGVKVYNKNLRSGTNYVDIEEYSGDEAKTFMLWNSMDDMTPLCESFSAWL